MSYFDHERLDAYRLAVEVAHAVASARFPRGQADLRDQAVRAGRSVALNIARGRARGGGAGEDHYRIALRSAAETCAALTPLWSSGDRRRRGRPAGQAAPHRRDAQPARPLRALAEGIDSSPRP